MEINPPVHFPGRCRRARPRADPVRGAALLPLRLLFPRVNIRISEFSRRSREVADDVSAAPEVATKHH